ncbi:hypothetical protein [Rhodococcus daqingensis]|uniref:Uncharacterized protein n=1 Tax=Rhodococcus daqingensis TaxID=2479363 RepID=A0ABW2RVM9_9NOCA
MSETPIAPDSPSPNCAPKTVFVVSPIGSPGTPEAVKASQTLEYIIRQALPAPEWEVVRADEEEDPGSITHMVIERIVNSDLIVADLTDYNPNVFYELAVAHGYKKPVVTLMTDGQKPPFDIVDLRTVFYDLANPESVHRAKIRLAASARAVLASGSTLTNPLVGYALFSTAGGLSEATPTEKVEFLLTQVLGRLTRVEGEIRELAPRPTVADGHGLSVADLLSRHGDTVLPSNIDRRQREVRYNVRRTRARITELLGAAELTEDERTEIADLRLRLDSLKARAEKYNVDWDSIV